MAVVPPPRVVTHLAEAVVRARQEAAVDADALRWPATDSWHLTLAFLGEVGEDRLADLQARLTRAARRHEPCQLVVSGAGRFGNRVLWAGIRGDTDRLRRLGGSVGAACRRAGATVEQRRLRPHLTLARARRPVDLRPLVETLATYAGPAWTAREAVLVRSRLGAGPGGVPAYDTVSRHPLGRGATGSR